MNFSNKEKTDIIMKHYSSPINKVEEIETNSKSIYRHSASCVDEINLNLKIENDFLVDAKFQGVGCAVFLSSADIFLEEIKNKPLSKVNEIANAYFDLINKKESNNLKIGKLAIFENVKIHLNRLECASLIYQAYNDFLEKHK
ncbi:iron-sulfur cluster assembly scaffold protein [[Mycoplasma] mobile]|uniref:Aminotransferase protein U homolog n=1 Tax=Mycoplasma mobile (strain ATCC 43663 / 163K / NCTC 11711) TaxID=267748 RepID=Q6KIL2_MYCM1|nr:iron-sulfur cluster assembly scaffold protein [[Mycoplasma] mobile]AAT27564.1 aminotransferase protein U homolog [Mycoplasma mobile 163K]